MASAIRKILLKKGINAAGKAGLGFIFDGRDNCLIQISFLIFILSAKLDINRIILTFKSN